MCKRIFSLLIALTMVLSCVNWVAPQHAHAASSQRQMESLDRGLVAVKTSGGVFLSWRLLGTESYNTAFNVYRDGTLIASNITSSTNYLDTAGSSSSSYYVRSVVSGSETTQSAAVKPWGQNYLDVPLQKPANVTMDGATVTYAANDATVADVDGDGAYEIILKWDPSNSQDNSKSGYTANVYVDCYELDGTMRWRIDLGRNIRAGAHYTQIIAYDLNGDGKAEVAMKTADGTVAGDGTVIGDADADYRNSSGYILSGPEYLTLFEGKTGKELVTIDYYPARGTVSSWGDSYGNRVDRFLAGVAYFDGKTPSLVVCRGYYTRCVIVSYEYKGGTLNREWVFDSNDSGNGDYAGEGNHNLSIADVDGDGYDEIVYGSAVIDHNGKGLYATGHGHGDALHVGDFDPDRSGLEVFQVHEETGSSIESIQFRDAGTGKTIWAKKLSKDTGRGLILNIDPEFYPYVTLASGSNYNTAGGASVTSSISGLGINFACYWDGDLYREGLDGTTVRKWDYNNNKVVTALSGSNVHSNNSTKSTPSLSGDILGDWREEVIWPTSDDKALRIYTTTDVTDAKLYTLMHDSQYRCAIAWQNVAYNQPPHTSYFIGPTMATPTQPSIYTVGSFSLAAPDGGSSGGETPAQTTAAPVQTTTVSGGAVTAGSYTHNFTENGKTSDFYTITGNTSTSKGSVTYAGQSLTTCLKMESSTNISFTAPSSGTLTLVFGGSTAAGGKSVKIDGSSQTIGSDGILTVDVAAGSHTVTKGDAINLFYMVYTPAGSSGGETHTHSYSSSVTTAATCTSAGVRTYSCSCGSSYTEAIAALGHSYSGGSCTRCGAADPNSGSQDTGTYDRVTVHDPSIVEADGMYYIFGSHMAWAKSKDLRSWTTFTTNVNTNYANIFATNAAWAANGGTQGNSAYDVSGNLWAPDVIYNEKLGKWCMYMSVNGDAYYSSIAMATADSIEGPYTYAGTVVYSGFANSTQADQTDFKQVTGTNTVPSRYLTNGAWNPQYGTNAIDPCVFYDNDGNLWMVYGSWFGGLFLLRLDESTGLRDYSYTYSTTTDASDEYLGIRLSGGYGCTGEGPYIVYDDATGYYYLYVTYGGLNATDSFGNYNMRLFRSKSVTGPYTDAAGNSAICTSSGADQTVKGIKLMGNYFFSSLANAPSGEGSTAGYKSPGHNSAFIDDSGNRFLIYHTRFNLGSEWHQVRVHQQFLNADGWPVTAVYEYRGNSISTGYTDAEIVGHYEFVNHGSTAGATNAGMLTTQNIVLNSNGTITGDVTGTWSRTSGTYYCTMVIDGVTYKGVFFKQQDESAAHNMVMTFSAIGSNNQSIWGSQTKAEASGWIIDSPAWWGNHSGAVQVTENIQSWTFTNTTYADAADNWDTASVVVFRSSNGTVSGSNYVEELLIRSDSYAVSEEYGWDTTGQAPFSGTANAPSDWASWLSANKSGASCTVTAQLVGDQIIVGFSNNGVVNVYSVPKNTSSSSPVYLSLTGEETTMTAWKATSNHIDISDAVAAAGGSSGDTHTHSYSSSVTTAATCVNAGVRTYTCSCGDSYTEAIPATGHSYVNGTCSVCGASDGSSSGTVTSGSYIHNFTDDGFTSDFYTFAGSQITDGKHGTYTYDFGYGTETLNYALKFDSKGSVTFTAPADGKLTIAAAASSTSRKIGVFDAANNEVGTLSIPNTNTLYVLTVDVSANTAYTVKRTSNESGLYYIAFVPNGSTGGDVHTHSYTSSVPTAATCETAGVRTYSCSCGDSYTEAIDPLGHSYTSEEVSPNCTTDGYILYTCSTCGATYTEAGTASQGHFYENGTCTYCGATDPDYVTEWEDTWTTQQTSQFTLNTAGTVTFTLAGTVAAGNWGHLDNVRLWSSNGEEIALVNGDFESWENYTIPGWTLTEADYCSMDTTAKNNKTYRLDLWQSADSDVYVSVAQSVSVGAGSYYFTYDIIGNSGLTGAISGSQTHTHSYTSKVTAPTCTAQGYTTYTCSCSDSYVADYVAATGHNYVSSIKAPTCTETGLRTNTCSKCGDVTTEVIAATGHSYSNGSCTVCGAKDPNYQAPDENIKNGLAKGDDGNYYYYINNEVQWNYTGLIANSAGRWYILNGQAQLSYDGLITFEGTKYLIKAGHVNTAFTGITKQEGVYYYFNAGVNDLEFEGLVYCNGMKAYVQDGEVNFNKTGVVEDEGNLVYVKYGIWRNTFKGLARTDAGQWIYMVNGTFDETYTGVAKLNANWVYVNAGYVDSSYSGTVNVNGVNYTVKYGVVQF